MIVVAQRVAQAAVEVDGREVSRIARGLCLLACAVAGDADAEVDWLADKIAGLRVFEDAAGRTNLALADVGGAVLLVPQFTLAADWRKGRRPSFTAAAAPDEARRLLERLGAGLSARGLAVATGIFGASMRVALVNDGPFTLLLDSRERPAGRPAPST
jgi:D-tyrosyl-tRNA(Tyr) deacylase